MLNKFWVQTCLIISGKRTNTIINYKSVDPKQKVSRTNQKKIISSTFYFEDVLIFISKFIKLGLAQSNYRRLTIY